MLPVMYFSQIFYKIPRGCLHPSILWKAKTNHCFPVAELLWFCGQFHINYCFVCKQM